jgi:Protein of unknown function (DUF3667)
MTDCLNCSTAFEGNFCNECGQKAKTHRFTLHEWMHEIPHSIFHVDSGFFHTFKSLCLRPGKMIREYLDGKRKDYFSPFLYVLVWCGVFIVVSHFVAKTEHQQTEITDLKSAIQFIEDNYYKIFVVSSILPLSISSFLVFYRSKLNFAEHLVLNSFVIAQLIVTDIIMSLINATHLKTEHKIAVNLVELALKFPFWVWAYFQFFKPKNIFLGLLQTLFAIIVTALLTSGMEAAAAYILLLFKTSSH